MQSVLELHVVVVVVASVSSSTVCCFNVLYLGYIGRKAYRLLGYASKPHLPLHN